MLGSTLSSDYNLVPFFQYIYNNYLLWMLTPLVIAIVLPILTMLAIYFSALFLTIHKARLVRRLREAVLEDQDLFKAGREIICSVWEAQGRLWHGYDVAGIENIPDTGPAMIIYYHGALPVDYYYLVAKVQLVKNRTIHSVVDKFLFRIPGLGGILQAFCCTPGTREYCTQELKDGHILGLSPGGVYEAQFGDHVHYEILWKERIGFAVIAKNTSVPIIPVFTQNIRETFRTFGYFRSFFKRIYHKIRFPIVPLYGNFPVKLRTVIGKPIEYDPVMDTPETIRDKCRDALQGLINDNQQKPGSIIRAFMERFKTHSS